MKLVIANVSRQIVQFNYRLPETTGVRTQMIPIGGQIEMSGVTTKEVIDAILDQHQQYGLLSADEIARTRKEYHGICYSVDKPVNVAKLQEAMENNTNVLTDLGRKIRQEAALATNARIESDLDEGQSGAGLRNFEMSVVEEEGRNSGDHKPVAEGTRVTRTEPGVPTPPRRAAAGRRR